MYESNGIVYAAEPVSGIKVSRARYMGNHMLLIEFSTDETRLFDATSLTGLPAFAPLAQEDVLKDFVVDHGILTWLDGSIDIAPEALYDDSFPYERIA